MMVLTSDAVAYFKKFLGTEGGRSLVFSVSHKGCSGLKYQTEAKVIAAEDGDYIPVLQDDFTFYVHKEAEPYLAGMRVDCQHQDLGQKRILYLNDRATNVCGCGESFQLKEHKNGN